MMMPNGDRNAAAAIRVGGDTARVYHLRGRRQQNRDSEEGKKSADPDRCRCVAIAIRHHHGRAPSVSPRLSE